jgi:hypothetical protein
MSDSKNAITVSGGNYSLTGKIINQSSGEGIEGLGVEVWDKDRIGKDDRLGMGITNPEGEFSVSFNEKQFMEFIFDKKPDLYFIVFDEDEKIHDTKKTPIKNADQNTGPIAISVNVDVRVPKGIRGPILSTPVDFLYIPDGADGGGFLPWVVSLEDTPEPENAFNHFQLDLG